MQAVIFASLPTIFLYFEPLGFFLHFWDPMYAHDAVILRHSTYVQLNRKRILFSKGGGGFLSYFGPPACFFPSKG